MGCKVIQSSPPSLHNDETTVNGGRDNTRPDNAKGLNANTPGSQAEKTDDRSDAALPHVRDPPRYSTIPPRTPGLG
ncbi:hypothetical protein L210DRAFT_3515672 [Boletus edulis BED1]|uniref:Uncharacterized protein n=1 Tax=Boletus edulis BED1 TaxID=1328754 RepID=A0AAD4GLT8_BOLED|nr:hypothetical protein L210DRAFT_3515672 [Boletus edulis BED1]